jgi:S-adenosylmethionine:tRNA ribosyltransferase-isomerase
MSLLGAAPLTHFSPADDRTATGPPEERGLARDEVRLLVAAAPRAVSHARFRDLPAHLQPGDVLVVNNSATLAAELDAELAGRGPVVVHLASRLDDGTVVLELRSAPDAAEPVLDATAGNRVALQAGAVLDLLEAYPRQGSSPTGEGTRLWRARHAGARPLSQHLLRYGRPVAYGYIHRPYPLTAYQTVFANRPGSAEMPSAGRPFTPEVLARLVARGVTVAAITLHTGVSSQETGEAPQPEWFEVSATTAGAVNAARAAGCRVVAVGTTVTRALESAVHPGEATATVRAASGWTERVVSREDPARVVTGLVTGWHNPDASHLLLVEAVAGAALTQLAYDEASRHGYLWHEFGDAALLLPDLAGRTERT